MRGNPRGSVLRRPARGAHGAWRRQMWTSTWTSSSLPTGRTRRSSMTRRSLAWSGSDMSPTSSSSSVPWCAARRSPARSPPRQRMRPSRGQRARPRGAAGDCRAVAPPPGRPSSRESGGATGRAPPCPRPTRRQSARRARAGRDALRRSGSSRTRRGTSADRPGRRRSAHRAFRGRRSGGGRSSARLDDSLLQGALLPGFEAASLDERPVGRSLVGHQEPRGGDPGDQVLVDAYRSASPTVRVVPSRRVDGERARWMRTSAQSSSQCRTDGARRSSAHSSWTRTGGSRGGSDGRAAEGSVFSVSNGSSSSRNRSRPVTVVDRGPPTKMVPSCVCGGRDPRRREKRRFALRTD